MINYVVTNSLYVVTNDTWKTIDRSIKCIIFAMIVKQNKYVNHPLHNKRYKPYGLNTLTSENKSHMKNNHIALYIDLLFCLIIMPLTIMLLPVDRWIVHNTAFLLTLIAYIYIIYFIYRWVCLPKLFMQKKYIHIAGLLITLTATTWLFTYFPVPSDHTGSPRQMEARMNMRTQTIWFFFLMVTGFSLAIELTFELFRQILAKQEIAAEKNKAELALYKAQINPHFMFNTLNMLYALVLSGSDKTESAFVKFSNILRYMYAQTHSENIPIGQEIEYIRQYTDLQKLRLNHHTRVTLTAKTDNETTPVPSMIFITFVENAFKYGTSADTDCNIQINICLKNGLLSFDTVNNIIRHVDSEHEGIGIANCRKRLELLYPGRYELENGPTGNVYITKLKIQL